MAPGRDKCGNSNFKVVHMFFFVLVLLSYISVFMFLPIFLRQVPSGVVISKQWFVPCSIIVKQMSLLYWK